MQGLWLRVDLRGLCIGAASQGSMNYIQCCVQLFFVRLARANVLGLRAFARVRWEKQLSHNVGTYDVQGF
jgi:hypothetical protein